ncbi:MAG: hypothetical protein J0H47_04725 [Gammaproteobacteria bacterium]|nr:hypothetical protein [Gammaproteobacteria bacterium]
MKILLFTVLVASSPICLSNVQYATSTQPIDLSFEGSQALISQSMLLATRYERGDHNGRGQRGDASHREQREQPQHIENRDFHENSYEHTHQDSFTNDKHDEHFTNREYHGGEAENVHNANNLHPESYYRNTTNSLIDYHRGPIYSPNAYAPGYAGGYLSGVYATGAEFVSSYVGDALGMNTNTTTVNGEKNNIRKNMSNKILNNNL